MLTNVYGPIAQTSRFRCRTRESCESGNTCIISCFDHI